MALVDTSEYGLTPAQYHAGLDKLWDALSLKGVQDDDVFTLCAERIRNLQDEVSELQDEVLGLEAEVSELNDEVSHLEDEVSRLEDEVSLLEDEDNDD